jgi:hypothetical protein
MRAGFTPVPRRDRRSADATRRFENQAHRAVQLVSQGQPMAHHPAFPAKRRHVGRSPCQGCVEESQKLFRHSRVRNLPPGRPGRRTRPTGGRARGHLRPPMCSSSQRTSGYSRLSRPHAGPGLKHALQRRRMLKHLQHRANGPASWLTAARRTRS